MISASAEETGEGQFQVRVKTGAHSFLMDEPADVGGLGSGPNPFDLLCAAMASCTLMTMKLYARRKGWSLDGVKVRVTHHKDSAEAKDRFDCVLDLGGANTEQREKLLSIASRCPVHLVLERGADVPTATAADQLDSLAA
jgi:putative redox protein